MCWLFFLILEVNSALADGRSVKWSPDWLLHLQSHLAWFSSQPVKSFMLRAETNFTSLCQSRVECDYRGCSICSCCLEKRALVVINKILGLGCGLADKALPMQLWEPEFGSWTRGTARWACGSPQSHSWEVESWNPQTRLASQTTVTKVPALVRGPPHT